MGADFFRLVLPIFQISVDFRRSIVAVVVRKENPEEVEMRDDPDEQALRVYDGTPADLIHVEGADGVFIRCCFGERDDIALHDALKIHRHWRE